MSGGETSENAKKRKFAYQVPKLVKLGESDTGFGVCTNGSGDPGACNSGIGPQGTCKTGSTR